MVKKDLSENPDHVWPFMPGRSLVFILHIYQKPLKNFNLQVVISALGLSKITVTLVWRIMFRRVVMAVGSLLRKYSSVAWMRVRGVLDQVIVVVLIIHYCVTNYHKAQWLKTTNIYFLTISRDRNPAAAQLDDSGSGSLMRLQSSCQPVLHHLKP